MVDPSSSHVSSAQHSRFSSEALLFFFFLLNMGAHHSVGLEHLLINIQPAERKLRSYGEVEHAFGIFENFLLSVTFPIVGI